MKTELPAFKLCREAGPLLLVHGDVLEDPWCSAHPGSRNGNSGWKLIHQEAPLGRSTSPTAVSSYHLRHDMINSLAAGLSQVMFQEQPNSFLLEVNLY